MCDHEDRDAQIFMQAAEQSHDFALSTEIQGCQWLVQDEQLWPRDERHGDCHPLALPAGEAGEALAGEFGGLDRPQSLVDAAALRGSGAPECPPVAVQPKHYRVDDADRLIRARGVVLWNVADGIVILARTFTEHSDVAGGNSH